MTDRMQAQQTEETRTALLEQLAHLKDEVDALRRNVGMIPEAVLSGRPLPDAPSFKELYAMLALIDERVYAPAVEAVASTGQAEVNAPEYRTLLGGTAWNEVAMDELLDRVHSSRAALVEALAGLSHQQWAARVTLDGRDSDIFGLTYAIIQHDAETLRTAAVRLHESRLTSRDEDLPK